MRVQYCFKLTRLATKDLTQPEFSRTMLSIVCVMKKKRKKKEEFLSNFDFREKIFVNKHQEKS